MRTAICTCAQILVAVAAVTDGTALESLYDPHQWFELRAFTRILPSPELSDGNQLLFPCSRFRKD
jgi:hypothetical protein